VCACVCVCETHQPVLARAMDTELSSRLHLDSLTTASQFAPGEITRNSRTPNLRHNAHLHHTAFSIFTFKTRDPVLTEWTKMCIYSILI